MVHTPDGMKAAVGDNDIASSAENNSPTAATARKGSMTVDEAEHIVSNNCNKLPIKFNPMMILFSLPLNEIKAPGGSIENSTLQLYMPHCNHNIINTEKLDQITNNVLGNPCQVKNTNRKTLGNDMLLVYIYTDKVRIDKRLNLMLPFNKQHLNKILKYFVFLNNSYFFVYVAPQVPAKDGLNENKKREPLRLVSNMPITNTTEYVTAMPDNDPPGGNWFSEWYNEGGEDYLSYDPRTEEGRDEIAKWNGWGCEWTEFVRQMKKDKANNDLASSLWIYYLALHFARHGSDKNIYCGLQEGMHRACGLIQSTLNAHLEPHTGLINPKDRPLRVSDFTKISEIIDLGDHIITEAVRKMNCIPGPDDKETNVMVNATLPADVTWISNDNANVPEVMSAMRKLSEALSDEKRTSSHRTAGAFMGDAIYNFMTRIASKSIESTPDFNETDCESTPRATAITSMKTAKKSDANVVEDNLFPTCELLADEAMKKYINDPFDDNHIKDVENLLTSKEGHASLPYYVDYSVLVKSEKDKFTAEIANAYYLIPVIMHFLYAEQYNKVMKTTANTPYLTELISYTLKYHCGGDMGELSSYHIHPAISFYKMLDRGSNNKKTCGDERADPIGATLTIFFMVSAAIALSKQEDETSHQKIKEQIKENATILRTACYMMGEKRGTTSMLAHLGKFLLRVKIICLITILEASSLNPFRSNIY